MAGAVPLRIGLGGLLLWVTPITVAVGVAGWYATIPLAGQTGAMAMVAAGAIVFAVMLASGAIIVRAARRGPAKSAFAFTTLAMVRVFVSLGLAVLAWLIWDLPIKTLLIWLLIFHMAMLAGECIWLARALQKDAFLVALGKIQR